MSSGGSSLVLCFLSGLDVNDPHQTLLRPQTDLPSLQATPLWCVLFLLMQSKLREAGTRAGLAWDSSLLAADLGTSTTLSDHPARTAPPDPSCWFCVLGDSAPRFLTQALLHPLGLGLYAQIPRLCVFHRALCPWLIFPLTVAFKTNLKSKIPSSPPLSLVHKSASQAPRQRPFY